MSLHFSVCICTYNRAELLASALDSACELDFPGDQYEIIVVDNGSSDHTSKVVRSHVQEHPAVRYVLEEVPGLSQARNRAWQEARGEFVAYIDDDCKTPEQWLSVAAAIIVRYNPDLFGGPYFPYYLEPKPRWFKDGYGTSMIIEEAGFLGPKGHLSGGNMFVRREVFSTIGSFNTDLGMVGDNLAFGEDPDFVHRAQNANAELSVYYDPALYVYHLVRPEKMRMRFLVRQRWILGRYTYRVQSKEHTMSLRHWVGSLGVILMILSSCTFGLLLRNREIFPWPHNYLYERILPKIYLLGKFYERAHQVTKKRIN